MNDLNLYSNIHKHVRHSNGLVALQVLYQFGSTSRAEIARKMGLNRSSSGYIIADLIHAGFVREVSKNYSQIAEGNHRGRPGVLLELVPQAVYFLGIEIGVEYITIILIDLTASIVDMRHKQLPCHQIGVEKAIGEAMELASSMYNEDIMSRLGGVGFSIPAHMNEKGYIFDAPLLKWIDVDFLKIASRKLPMNLSVAVENDANAFAIGAIYQSNISTGVILFLVLESGIGGGIVIDGKLFRGGNGLAGEIGHLTVQNHKKENQRLESVISLEQLLSRYHTLSGQSNVTIDLFIQYVQEREPIAVSLADEWAKYLGLALVQACRVIDPNKIILGGSMAKLYSLIAVRVNIYIESYQETPFPIPEIILNKNPELGSAYGAACILHQRFMSLT
ncbi:Sugar kinase of the NBD/HSP70 family [Commensalibacter communis]|uniref:May contain an N-terminal HTH domain (NagC) n=2 Tax=Commensalibacter communis TaxID=2972786 RepID=A0A9W4TNP6_9PROT|nr:ROK family transcriptional regulator [Commensalibacter communis]CAI3959575.1 Sugar kinase of the NBD/HSP70 family [Commensalibacter communis]CAI3960980.1 Sugar kinase of the NBD/HSP70 family [Commensalibacter communis]CAI3961111.1 Sugar kinase of the NBD/HSP70 family [Commensalibacter communis]CAI3961224.1 Sugar kinase of the NBD/HSP70 family [Commensalibacter communis]